MAESHFTGQKNSKATSRFSVYCFGFGWVLLVGVLWWLLAGHLGARELVLLTVLAYIGCWGGYFAASIRDRRQKAVRFIAFTASVSLALGIVEAISLSWKIDYRPIVGRSMRPWQNPINLLDPQLIHARGMFTRGNLRSLVDRQETSIVRPYDVRFDHNGFRNENESVRADCIVIGDSFVEGFHVLSEELHTTQVAESTGLEVVNLGRAGYGPQQELIVLERYGLSLRPKLCLWVFFEGNDLADVWEYEKLLDRWPQTEANYFSWRDKSFTKNIFWWIGRRIRSRGAQPPPQ